MEAKATKSVRFTSDTDLKFSKLSEKLGRSKQELFGQMVDYFYKSKKDPGDLNDEMLKKELSQGINRIIAFIKTQEKEALTPLMADQRELQRDLTLLQEQFGTFFLCDDENYVHGFYQQTQNQHRQDLEQVRNQQQEMARTLQNLLAETRTYQNEVRGHREAKSVLKARFRALLDAYIQQREALNAITQGRAVKELQEHVRSQVDQL